MNLAAHLAGCWRVLRGDDNWQSLFDLSRKGLLQSFLAVALTIPAYYICGLAISAERAQLSGSAPYIISPLIFGLIALIYSLSFAASVYIISAAFNKPETFRPWVIVRHWCVFFCVLFAASFYGLYLMGVLPFIVPNLIALGLYLATLAIDIRLAQRLGGFDLTPAIFTACIIFAMGLSVLLIGVVQAGGTA